MQWPNKMRKGGILHRRINDETSQNLNKWSRGMRAKVLFELWLKLQQFWLNLLENCSQGLFSDNEWTISNEIGGQETSTSWKTASPIRV